ncbi:hypothetical protein CW736_08465 [Nonlabens sp. MB-3u-79]|nr:hypothetical protein CW736_08465 [Nonlabens sp. MB-3u-79]
MLFTPITDPTTPILQDLVEPRGQEVGTIELPLASKKLRVDGTRMFLQNDLFGMTYKLKY